jgi:hypothetical protein
MDDDRIDKQTADARSMSITTIVYHLLFLTSKPKIGPSRSFLPIEPPFRHQAKPQDGYRRMSTFQICLCHAIHRQWTLEACDASAMHTKLGLRKVGGKSTLCSICEYELFVIDTKRPVRVLTNKLHETARDKLRW